MTLEGHGVEEGPWEQGADEEVYRTLDVTKVGSSTATVTSPTMKVLKLSDGTDVTTSVTEGTMSVSGQVISLKKLKSLTAGETYRVFVYYTKGGSDLFNEIRIRCPHL